MPTEQKNEPQKTSFSLEEVQAIVAKTIEGTFAQVAPMMKDMAWTPDKIREAMKPFEDVDKIAQDNRLKEEWHEQERQRDENIRLRQQNCRHKDEQEKYTIRLQHNFHDNMPRGICSRCDLFIYPMHWDWRPVKQPDGKVINKGFVVQAHPLYWLVQEIESRKG